MDFIKALYSRYATKLYDADKTLNPIYIESLKEAVQLAPSSINSQPWHFTFVKNPEQKAKFAEASYFNKEKILDAPLLIVLSRTDNVNEYIDWMRCSLPKGANDYYDATLSKLSEEELKTWFSKQLYLALGVLLSACASLGLDSTPMEGIECDKYDTLLPFDGYHAEVAVCVGYRSDDDHNAPDKYTKQRRAKEEIITEI